MAPQKEISVRKRQKSWDCEQAAVWVPHPLFHAPSSEEFTGTSPDARSIGSCQLTGTGCLTDLLAISKIKMPDLSLRDVTWVYQILWGDEESVKSRSPYAHPGQTEFREYPSFNRQSMSNVLRIPYRYSLYCAAGEALGGGSC